MDVLILSGQNLANVPYLISAHQRLLGIDSRCWTMKYDSYIKYPEDIITPLPRNNLCMAETWKKYKMDEAKIYHIHDTYGLPPVLQRHIINKGRPFILHYHGTYLRTHGGSRMFNKHAKYIFVSTPDLLKHIPPEYKYKAFYLPNPVSIDPYYTCMNDYVGKVKGRSDKFTVSHSPTNIAIKGSRTVLDILRYLKQFYDIDYKITVNKDHWESLQNIKNSELYLDQFNIGAYGISAVEALLMGKAVICYIDQRVAQSIPNCPIKTSKLDGLADAVKSVLYDWDKFERTKADRVSWAKTFHNPTKIAEYLVNIYEGMEPIRDPNYFLRWR